MPSNIPFNNQQEYYDDESLHGVYQYVKLSDIINNFQLNYVGDDKLINNIRRDIILFHAKRGLQEINYDALKEIKAIELDLNDNLTLILPDDYVNYARISWVDDCGRFHPMIENVNTIIAKSYLQDNEFNILFDEDGDGLQANENSYDPALVKTSCSYPTKNYEFGGYDYIECPTKRFGLNTTEANYNGWFVINKRQGVIKFSSQVKGKSVVVEYISDGLEYRNEDELMINKLAEQALYQYMRFMILDNTFGVQEYIVKRAKRDYYNSLRIAKARLQGIKYNQLIQAIRGKSKWIK